MSNVWPSLNPKQSPLLRHCSRYLPYEKFNWHQTLTNSGLPSDIQSVIKSVIKQSRLLRFEKVEVVDELVAHFVDGKAAGKCYARTNRQFWRRLNHCLADS